MTFVDVNLLPISDQTDLMCLPIAFWKATKGNLIKTSKEKKLKIVLD